MNLTENTKVRIRVPKALYESIQAELGKMEEAEGQQASVEEVAAAMDKAVAFAKKLAKQIADKKGGSLTQKDFFRLIDNFRYKVKSFGPFKRASEPEEINEAISGKAEELKDFYEKVKEQVDGGTDLDSAITFVMNDLGMEMMAEGEEINEYVGMNPAEVQAMELAGTILAAVAAGTGLTAGIVNLAKKVKSAIKSKKSGEAPMAESEEINEYVGMSPAEMQAMELAGQILAAVAAGTGLTAGIVNLAKKVKDKIKSKKSSEDAMAEELEEVFDLDFGGLMEAMKDASKKKAEDKKKKEAEAKKKKVEDEKKKKEAEAKKKAAIAKKK